MKRAQKKLNDQEVQKILAEAKKESYFDYLALKTLIALDLRRAELVGQNDTKGRMVVKLDAKGEEWYFQTKSHENPGMLIEKLTDKGIWLRRKKHGEDTFVPIPHDLRAEIDQIIGHRTSGPIFPRTTGWVWYRIRHYARNANIPDWQYVHPHALRWHAGDAVFEKHGIKAASSFLGHKNVATTWSHYTHKVKPEVMSAASQTLEDKFEGL